MKQHELKIVSTGHKFLEAPRWHDGKLWASDFFNKEIIVFESEGKYRSFAHIEGQPSGLGFLSDGSVLAVSQIDQKLFRISASGDAAEYYDFSKMVAGLGNDMFVSKSGHAYVGNFGFILSEEEPRPTNLIHIDPAGVGRLVPGDVIFPNGNAETLDGRLLVAETFANKISAFKIAADGTLSDKHVWADLGPNFHPDGIALDAVGGVWFGNALTLEEDSGFYRVLEGGEITDKVAVKGAWSVACAFGGKDLSKLYLMCNETTLDDFHEGRSSAYVAFADVGRQGVP